MSDGFVHWIGDVKITKLGAAPTDTNKFETCRHRSDQEIEEMKLACCGQRNLKRGYKCYELRIFPLSPGLCLNCPKHSPK